MNRSCNLPYSMESMENDNIEISNLVYSIRFWVHHFIFSIFFLCVCHQTSHHAIISSSRVDSRSTRLEQRKREIHSFNKDDHPACVCPDLFSKRTTTSRSKEENKTTCTTCTPHP
mmetsp:Transcript_23393/g.67408  ORF Transcript_23393/g.67408 Transcript_23393/m.67408 type:complete len:115 (+) Transcript_23393:65-409(+)